MRITKKHCIQAYKDFEWFNRYKPRKYLLNMYAKMSYGELRELTEDEFWHLVFIAGKTERVTNPIALRLTQNDTKRLLDDVITTYINETQNGFTWRDNERKVKKLLALFEKREVKTIPPIFVRKKPVEDVPGGSFHIDDGIHRLLAYGTYCKKYHKKPKIKAYIAYFPINNESPKSTY